MVEKSYGNSGRFLNAKWHETRRAAREETFSIEEWSDIDIARFDLDTVDFDRKAMDTKTEAQIETEGAAKSGRPLDDEMRE